MGISNGQQGSSASCAFGKQRGAACCRVPPRQCEVAQLGASQLGQLDARLPTGFLEQESALLAPSPNFPKAKANSNFVCITSDMLKC